MRETWSAVATDAMGKDGIWVIGDMNAEMRDVIEERHPSTRMTEADMRMEGVMRGLGLRTKGGGRPTHRSGTEIDHILINETHAASTDDAGIAPGI